MNWNGLLSFPKLHRGFGKLRGVRKIRPKQISPYAAADGTPAAEMREVNATPEGRIVQVMEAEIPQMTRTALRVGLRRIPGRPSWRREELRPLQLQTLGVMLQRWLLRCSSARDC
jgi:hypothetical protein